MAARSREPATGSTEELGPLGRELAKLERLEKRRAVSIPREDFALVVFVLTVGWEEAVEEKERVLIFLKYPRPKNRLL